MKAGSFIFDGVTSESLNAVIQTRPVIETPKRKVLLTGAYGQDGLTPYDEGAYENTPLSLILYTGGPSAVESREAVYDTFDHGTYKDLILYSDDTKIYKVLMDNPPKFESRYYMGEGLSFEVGFTVKPYKFLRNSPLKTLTSSGNITNPTRYPSLPLITVTGSGDITLTINGKQFSLKGVSSYIRLDSAIMEAYQDTGGILVPQNTKVYTRDYPFLKPGANTISWTGTVTKLEILPRWRTLT